MNIDIRDRNTQIGIGLVVVGLLALIGNLGLFASLGSLIGLVVFVAGGVLVLRTYGGDPRRAWTLPAGFGLIGLGLAALDTTWGGGAFLGSLGLGFLAIFVVDRSRWWGILVGGVLLTLGLTASYEDWVRPGVDAGGTVFFLGLAATFAALYLLPSVNQRWAVWPALALAVVAVLTIGYRGGWVLPVILIGVGAWMLSRRWRPEHDASGDAAGGASRPEHGGVAGTQDDGGAGTATGPVGPAPDGTGARGPGYDEPSATVDASVRTPAQTPGSAAVQPSARPETPEQAARRFATSPDPAGASRRDVPPYGQEPAGWMEDVDPAAGDEAADDADRPSGSDGDGVRRGDDERDGDDRGGGRRD